VRPDAEPHPGRRANAVPRASRCLVDVDQSRHRRAHRPGGTRSADGSQFRSDHHGRAAGRRAWYFAFCQAVSVADPDQPLKAPKATNTVSASFPSACVRFRPGGERQQMPTTARPSRVMRRAKSVPKKGTALHIPKGPIACRSAPAATRPRSSTFAPPAWCRPRQTAPEAKDTGTGFANLSGKCS
jgi:hypothetical protein